MIGLLLDPFRTLATLLVGLLPADAGSHAEGIAIALGIFLAFLIIVAPFIALGAWLERRDRRTS